MNQLLSLAAIFISSFAIGFSGAIMPGPVFTAVVSESGRIGAKAGPLFMTGHAFLELALVTLIALGLGPILMLRPVFVVTAMAGGTIMLAMAVSMFVSLPRLEFDLADKGVRHGRVMLTGAALSLSNPYWIIWWVTIGLGWIQQSLLLGLAGGACFYLGHIASDYAWYGFVSFTVSRGRKFLTTKRYRVLIGACAALLCFFAFGFLWSGGKAMLELRPWQG